MKSARSRRLNYGNELCKCRWNSSAGRLQRIVGFSAWSCADLQRHSEPLGFCDCEDQVASRESHCCARPRRQQHQGCVVEGGIPKDCTRLGADLRAGERSIRAQGSIGGLNHRMVREFHKSRPPCSMKRSGQVDRHFILVLLFPFPQKI